MKNKTELGWHTLPANGYTRWSHELVKQGTVLQLPDPEPPVLCKRGYHAARHVWGALLYAPSGPVVLCRVSLSGTIIRDGELMVASKRTCLKIIPEEVTLQKFIQYAAWNFQTAYALANLASFFPDQRDRIENALSISEQWADRPATLEELYSVASAAVTLAASVLPAEHVDSSMGSSLRAIDLWIARGAMADATYNLVRLCQYAHTVVSGAPAHSFMFPGEHEVTKAQESKLESMFQ